MPGPQKRQMSMADYASNADPKRSAAPITGNWESVADGGLLVFTANGLENRNKVAGFDMDQTIIKTQSGGPFPRHKDDWAMWHHKVAPKLRSLHSDGYKVVIFTNQRGIELKHTSASDIKHKIGNVCKAIGIPIQVFVSTGSPEFRKPYVGMWEAMEKKFNGDVDINRAECFYCGDAAGRLKTSRRRKDHSCADRSFAINLCVRFYTPEQFFLDQPQEEPFELRGFNPVEHLKAIKSMFEPEGICFPHREGAPELILMVGSPASGKSHIAAQLCEQHGYVVINQDTLGNRQKCEDATERNIDEGNSIIVDNTNRNPQTRAVYLRRAKSRGYRCRAVITNCDFEMAVHNNNFRKIVGADPAHKSVDKVVLRTFFKSYEPPTAAEGFDDLIYANFVPKFRSDEQKRVYLMVLNDF